MIKLGTKVKCTVTGFEGIVTSSHEYLHGCIRLSVQPPVGKDGKVPESHSFDEPQLEVVELGAARIGSRKTGGPAKEVPQNRTE